MTREEEINIAALRYIEENSISTISSNKDSFIEGAKWSDKHPISPWISVDDDLPCNHEELMSKYPFGYKKRTVNVLTFLPNGNVVKDSMGYREKWWNGRQWDGEKWEWESLRKPTHWVPIPKLPKE